MPRLSKLLSSLLFVVAAALAGSAAAAEEDGEFARLAKMNIAQLDEFVGLVTASVGQDSLRMRELAQRRDCLELTRVGNAFALGYRSLAAVNEALKKLDAKAALGLRANVVQSRVLTFAARVRADELLGRSCVSYTPPTEFANDARYAAVSRVATAEFTEAVIEARQAADANLAGAVAAGTSRACPAVVSAVQSIQLFVPYLDKLLNDIAGRPEALGPRASRRGLIQSRALLINAANQLDREFSAICGVAPPTEEGPAPAASP